MFDTILKVISGKVKFELGLPESDTVFYIDRGYTIDEEKMTFIDALDNKEYSFGIKTVNRCIVNTFGDNAIPPSYCLNDYLSSGESTFSQTFSADINDGNRQFDEKLSKIKFYRDAFANSTPESQSTLRAMTSQGLWRDLEFLRILGSDRCVYLSTKKAEDTNYLRGLYVGIIDSRLNEAIADIDESIVEMDHPEFTAEAKRIKSDILENVNVFKQSIKHTAIDKLVDQWPTLLNPSPFLNLSNV